MIFLLLCWYYLLFVKKYFPNFQMSSNKASWRKKNFLKEMDYEENSPNPTPTTSKVYAEVFKGKPSSYFEYESYSPKTEDIENYSIVKKIGQGKYSLVFEGVKIHNNENVVIKMLKPIKKTKIKREVKILDHLKHGVNIISLVGVVNTLSTGMYALIFETTANNEDFKEVYLKLGEHDIKFYIFEILRALDFCHSRGIMHRDVKPHNIIVDRKNRKLQLIDFGLAEYYRPGERYNVRVASRHYKGPELLVDYGYYDYSLDLWSLGCVFAAMIFRREPFFQGKDNRNQLECIIKVLGTTKFNEYLRRYSITMDDTWQEDKLAHSKRPWQRFVTLENEHLVSEVAFEFLDSLLCYDHMERLTAKEALEHKYLLSVKCAKNVPPAEGSV